VADSRRRARSRFRSSWSHNLDATPTARVTVDGREVEVRAERLDEAAKAAVWPRLVAIIPQFGVYVTRTDRTIKVYRLRPVAAPG
jgi:deazaflavin-dependent oxidoreductase (nitroreductase family)